MSLVVLGLWINTKTWDLNANNINVIYTDEWKIVLLDQFLLKKNSLDTLIQVNNSIKHVYLDLPYTYFLTRNVDTPFFKYDMKSKSINYYNIKGTFSDFSPKSRILLALSNYSNSKTYNLDNDTFFDVYGYRIIGFKGKILYIDRNYNLKDFETEKVILSDAKNVSVSTNYLIVITSNRAIVMDDKFNIVREIVGSFFDGFLVDVDGDAKEEVVLYDYFGIYIYKNNDREVVANLRDSISCVMILDYNNDGSYDILVSTKKETKLFEQMPKTNLELDEVGYSVIDTKCGSLWGIRLVSQKPIKEDPFSVKIKYKLDGIEFSIDNRESEFVIISLLDAKGSFIRTIYSGKFKGVNNFNIILEKTGVYLISIKGERNVQKVSFIWNKK